MQAIILATADDQKLWPLTESTPSPLLAIGNRPVMEIVIEQLARAGLKKFIICLHQMAGNIELYFGTGSRWGVALEYVLMREAWGSAGSLGWAKSLISETFIVMQADAIIDLDIQAALDQHQQNSNKATVVLHQTTTQADPWCSETGVYIFEPDIINWIPARKKYDISTQLLPALSEAGLQVGAFITEGYWNPLDSFGEFQDAQRTLLYSMWQKSPFHIQGFLSNYSPLVGKEVNSGIWVGRNTVIHPGALLVPPVLLGENIRVGQGVVLGPEVVVGAGSIVSQRVSIHSSTIFEHTFVGQLLHIEDRLVEKGLVVDTKSSEYIQIVDHLLLGETPQSVPATLLTRSLEMALAGLLLLLTAPLFVTIGLISWLSFGRVFQRTPRVEVKTDRPDGERPSHESYSLIHFRTRSETDESTWLGSWFERLEWNRLPELYNVLTGNMRLIGTKPQASNEVSDLTELRQQSENEHAPGFTGLWYVQTSPCDGSDETLVSGVANAYYQATRSLRQDVKILLSTPQAWFKRIKNRGCENEFSREG